MLELLRVDRVVSHRERKAHARRRELDATDGCGAPARSEAAQVALRDVSEREPASESAMSTEGKQYTVEQLRAMKLSPELFGDGARGMAFQTETAREEPRFGREWRRKDRRDPGRTYTTVDGNEVASLEEAVAKLALPMDPESPHAQMLALREHFRREDEERAAREEPKP
jgi:hypothetical protein